MVKFFSISFQFLLVLRMTQTNYIHFSSIFVKITMLQLYLMSCGGHRDSKSYQFSPHLFCTFLTSPGQYGTLQCFSFTHLDTHTHTRSSSAFSILHLHSLSGVLILVFKGYYPACFTYFPVPAHLIQWLNYPLVFCRTLLITHSFKPGVSSYCTFIYSLRPGCILVAMGCLLSCSRVIWAHLGGWNT